MYKQPITLINRLQGHRGTFELYPVIIPRTHYQDMTSVKLSDTLNVSNAEGYIQIPHDNNGYLPPKEWKALVDKTGKWTLQEKDFVIKGEHDLVDVKDNLEEYDYRVVEKLEDVDYGDSFVGHYGVYLK